MPIVEPPDNPDLGPVELRRLALARLTEVEVHGTDLDVGRTTWNEMFVRNVLPMRLEWLNSRWANHRDIDTSIHHDHGHRGGAASAAPGEAPAGFAPNDFSRALPGP